MTTTVTVTPSPVKPNVPLWLSGHQCPRIEYNPTSEYKLKKGENTGWGVICQYTSRSQKEMNAIYVGGLDSRHAEGYGEWHSEDERLSYHGGWKDNVASGYGKYADSWTTDWPDSWARFLPGDADTTAKFTYVGGFKDGYFHGYGELTFKDKSKYEGSWKEGRRWGYGKYTKDDGTITEFQIEGAVKPAPKKEEKKDDKKDPPPQFIYVQGQPQIIQQPVIPQPVLQVSPPNTEHQHQAQAGVAFTWGHGSPQQQITQPAYIYATPGVEVPIRTTTPQPIPVQYTVGEADRPLTPQHGRTGSQSYLVTAPTIVQPATPGSPPYPDIENININLGGSPSNTAYFPHM